MKEGTGKQAAGRSNGSDCRRPMDAFRVFPRLSLLLLLVTFGACLHAQPPIPPDNGGNDNGGETKPADPPVTSGLTEEDIHAILDERQQANEQYIEERVDQEVRRRFEDFSPIRSRRHRCPKGFTSMACSSARAARAGRCVS